MLERIMLQQHGCFSVDREGTDMQAFRQAVQILQDRLDLDDLFFVTQLFSYPDDYVDGKGLDSEVA